MAKPTPEQLQQRDLLFSAFTGQRTRPSADTDVRSMLQTVYGTVRRGVDVVDTKEAARRLGVSQRTVQRWLKGEHKPSSEPLKKLRTKSRQAVTTKAGRARSLKRAMANQKVLRGGVKVRVQGKQGPMGYERDNRSAQQKLSPEEHQMVMQAYAEGGDAGAMSVLQDLFSQKYVDGWNFESIKDFRIDGLGEADRDDPRAL